jgi:hypothetical protein
MNFATNPSRTPEARGARLPPKKAAHSRPSPRIKTSDRNRTASGQCIENSGGQPSWVVPAKTSPLAGRARSVRN